MDWAQECSGGSLTGVGNSGASWGSRGLCQQLWEVLRLETKALKVKENDHLSEPETLRSQTSVLETSTF